MSTMAFDFIFHCHKDQFWSKNTKHWFWVLLKFSVIAALSILTKIPYFWSDVPPTWVNIIKLVSKSMLSIVLLYRKHLKDVKHILILTPLSQFGVIFLTCTYTLYMSIFSNSVSARVDYRNFPCILRTRIYCAPWLYTQFIWNIYISVYIAHP